MRYLAEHVPTLLVWSEQDPVIRWHVPAPPTPSCPAADWSCCPAAVTTASSAPRRLRGRLARLSEPIVTAKLARVAAPIQLDAVAGKQDGS